MSTAEKPLPNELTAQETAALLRSILAAVKKDKRRRWVEIGCAIVLSLATTASAWCAYEASRWSGVQTFRLAAASRASRAAAESHVLAMEERAGEAMLLISYLQAKSQGDQRLEKMLRDRFPREMKAAVEAWLKTDPFTNPAAPSSPFKMPEYVQEDLKEAKRQTDLFAQEQARAEEAHRNADRYVLLTVLFASVLFFAGVGGTFDSPRLRLFVFVIAVVLLGGTLIGLGTMPICLE